MLDMQDAGAVWLVKSDCLNPNATKNVPIRDLESFEILVAFGFKFSGVPY